MAKYIDAEAFKRRILYYGTVHEADRIPIPFYKRYFAEAYVAILRWVCEEVDDTPTTDVEEMRHGHWKHTRDLYRRPDGNQLFYGKICSVCNNVSPYETPYCMNCGVKMDEGCTPLVADPILTRQTND